MLLSNLRDYTNFEGCLVIYYLICKMELTNHIFQHGSCS
jgi:hypothetical protein